MLKQNQQFKRMMTQNGFSLTETVVATAIFGTIASISFPVYFRAINVTEQRMAEAEITAIPPIISAYVNETGETPSTWDDLSSISAIMTNSGPASGPIETPIILQSSKYELKLEGPNNSIYNLTATSPIKEVTIAEPEANKPAEERDIFAIRSCFNVSNGASDLDRGNISDIEENLNCA